MRKLGHAKRAACGAAMLATAALATPVLSEEPVDPVRPSHNMFGITGLIDTPTADMQPDAQVSVTSSFFGGFLRNTISAQFLPGVEAAFRYSIIEDFFNRAGQDDLFDRSFDIKVRLLSETERWPALAIGLQDFLGTGIYSGEYIAATKGFETEEWGSFRLSAGLGWGRFASEDGINNPLAALSPRFRRRGGDFGLGGNVNLGQYFRGEEIGFFGGVEWQTPIEDLTAKVEYSQDRYERERLNSDYDQALPINFGLEYRPADGIEVGAYYMYGSEIGVRVSFSGNPFRPLTDFDPSQGPQPIQPRPGLLNPEAAGLGALADATGATAAAKISDPRLGKIVINQRLGTVRWAEAVLTKDAPGTCPTDLATAIDAEYGVVDVVTFSRADGSVLCTVSLRPAGQHAVRLTSRVHAGYPTDWYQREDQRTQLVEVLAEELAPENIGLLGIEIGPRRIEVYIENKQIASAPKVIGRTARALTRTMPPSVEVFEVTLVEGSLAVATIILQRSDLEDQVNRPNAARRAWATAKLTDPEPVAWGSLLTHKEIYPRFSWSVGPGAPLNLFDPDQPLRADFNLVASGQVEFLPGLSVSGTVVKRLIGQLDEITRGPGSNVDNQVRSQIAQYLSRGDPAITRLTVDYVTKLASTMYGRVSAGMLERMYAGVSAEALWKPTSQSWGLGLELNFVRQRGFNTQFDLRGYETLTGHASLYWDTGFYDLAMQIDAGRYLAGDWGGTFQLTRRFSNGWEMGGFFTITTIPFSEFGEGSFDKGLILSIPFNWGLPFETRQRYTTRLRPLTRDGGQRLDVSNRIYPNLADADRDGLRSGWEDFWE